MLVLLACYNGGRWIGRQIDSILAQEAVAVRCVIADDGSSDETLQEIARFLPTGRVTLSGSGPPTGSAAQNFLRLIRAASAAGFDFVALADQDDVWQPAKLSRACRALGSCASAGYSSATIATWPDGRELILRQAMRVREADFLFEGAGQGCTFVLRVEFYERVRRFVTAHEPLTRAIHYHDWMIYALARSWGQPWTFDPSPSVHYRQHAGNDTGARASTSGVRKRLTLVKRGWYRTQLAAVVSVCAAAAPEKSVIAAWRTAFESRKGWRRRLRLAGFALRAGRRKRLDNAVVVFAALAGWI